MPTTRVIPCTSTALLLDCAPSSHEQQRVLGGYLILQLRKTGPSTTREGGLTYIIAAHENQKPLLRLFTLLEHKGDPLKVDFPYLGDLAQAVRAEPGVDTKHTYLYPEVGFSRTRFRPTIPSQGNYFWTGTYTAHPGKRDQILRHLAQFADEIVDLEPETLSYLVLVPRDERDQDTLYLWEEYTSETALREVHMKSKTAIRLKNTIGPLLEDRTMAGFTEI